MNRREFITLLGGTEWPGRSPRAQQPAMPLIGFLAAGHPDRWPPARVPSGPQRSRICRRQNVTIDSPGPIINSDRLPGLVAELVRRQVAVIVTAGNRCGVWPRRQQRRCPCFRRRRRSGQGWPRRQPEPAGRQRHRCQFISGELPQSGWGSSVSCGRGARIGLLVDPRPEYRITLSDVQPAALAMGQQIEVLEVGSTGKSMRPSQPSCRAARRAVRRRAARFSPSARNWSTWRPATGCPQSILPRICRSRRTDELRDQYHRCLSSGRRLRRSDLKGPSPPTCRSCRRPSSNSSSTSRPPRRSASKCRRRCSRAPTR